MYRDIGDRRKFSRLRTKLPLQYKNLERLPNAFIPSTSKDLSRGGVCLLSHEFIPVASRMVVVLELEYPKLTQVKVISKAIWSQKAPTMDSYLIGLRFFAMTKEDEHSLGLFLDRELA